MTQRIFDIKNEKDMADLWDILSEEVVKIEKDKLNTEYCVYIYSSLSFVSTKLLKINWHDKTKITRPIQEATDQDIGKLCYFWDYDEQKESGTGSFGKLCIIDEHKVEGTKYQGQNIGWFPHCCRLTKQEIEELC